MVGIFTPSEPNTEDLQSAYATAPETIKIWTDYGAADDVVGQACKNALVMANQLNKMAQPYMVDFTKALIQRSKNLDSAALVFQEHIASGNATIIDRGVEFLDAFEKRPQTTRQLSIRLEQRTQQTQQAATILHELTSLNQTACAYKAYAEQIKLECPQEVIEFMTSYDQMETTLRNLSQEQRGKTIPKPNWNIITSFATFAASATNSGQRDSSGRGAA